jgi:hypothetical protein
MLKAVFECSTPIAQFEPVEAMVWELLWTACWWRAAALAASGCCKSDGALKSPGGAHPMGVGNTPIMTDHSHAMFNSVS